MTEERTEYMTPGEVADKLLRQEQCIAQLESANDGYNLIQRRHAETITAQAVRIAELEATVWRQMDTIARLEQDNRRLRHLDAMPVDAMFRYYLGTLYDVRAAKDIGYTVQQFDSDDSNIGTWFAGLDGGA